MAAVAQVFDVPLPAVGGFAEGDQLAEFFALVAYALLLVPRQRRKRRQEQAVQPGVRFPDLLRLAEDFAEVARLRDQFAAAVVQGRQFARPEQIRLGPVLVMPGRALLPAPGPVAPSQLVLPIAELALDLLALFRCAP